MFSSSGVRGTVGSTLRSPSCRFKYDTPTAKTVRLPCCKMRKHYRQSSIADLDEPLGNVFCLDVFMLFQFREPPRKHLLQENARPPSPR